MANSFKSILHRAEKRKGGELALLSLLTPILKEKIFAKTSDDRILSMMAKVINQAGFSWRVIERKWPQFEEAFFGFDLDQLALLTPDQWDAYTQDKRVVRHGQKIRAVMENSIFVRRLSAEYGSFAKFMMTFAPSDQIGLMAYLKKHGARLGGNSGQYLLRSLGRDSFILSRDVILALRDAGLDIHEKPTSKSDMQKIQNTFNNWHEETGIAYTHLSQIAAFSIGADKSINPIENKLKNLGL